MSPRRVVRKLEQVHQRLVTRAVPRVLSVDAAMSRAEKARRRFYSYSGMMLLIIFLVFIGLWLVVQAYLDAVGWVDHSHKVKDSISSIQKGVADAETAKRGYLLTHDDAYLVIVGDSKVKAREGLAALRKLIEDNPEQQKRIDLLEPVLNVRLDNVDKVLRLEKEKGIAAALQYLSRGIWLASASEMQTILAPFYEEEQALLDMRAVRAERLSQVLAGGLVAFAAMLAWFVWYGLRRLEDEREMERAQTERLALAVAEKDDLLQQRELLLREVNHRVKNSLTQIGGMLRLQLRVLGNEDARKALNDALSRIMAIGRVHEQMYLGKDVGSVDAKAFLEPLSREVVDTLLPPDSGRLETEVEALRLPLEKAVSLALIVNELLTNAAKYARPVKGDWVISLTLKKAGAKQFRLSVADNGPGLPAGHDMIKSKSLGMRLITQLCRQLDGELDVKSTPKGAKFELTLPLPAAKALGTVGAADA